MTTERSGEFVSYFENLTNHEPMPWQVELFDRLMMRQIPEICNLPTGLGKTSVIPIWLIALFLSEGRSVPRRLLYVVNRRTVVDQTTTEVMRIRRNLKELKKGQPLAISTLRGQFADNREWSADPSRPAVICGTVDMIGSRLLFGGYRIGFKSKPMHAGFLGQDALLVHDESHLEPAFQHLIETIKNEQVVAEGTGELPWPKLEVMALSATTRRKSGGHPKEVFELTSEERKPPEDVPDPPTEPIHHVWRRLKASKKLHLHSVDDDARIAEKIGSLALEEHKSSNATVVVFVRTLDDVSKVFSRLIRKDDGLAAAHVQRLTGTMRGLERDALVRQPVFIRFLPVSDRPEDVNPAEGTVYLVCTSAGEVGVNLSADHMVCDLSTFDSMTQRLGRVNRFGDRDDTRIDVVHPSSFDDRNLNPQRKATLDLLGTLPFLGENAHDASPLALETLNAEARHAAFAPAPTIPRATDILFDAWALTTIRSLPGRPPLTPYLHGIADWEPPRTTVAWRQEVDCISDELIERHGTGYPWTLLEDYPLKPHELLTDTSERVYRALAKLASRSKVGLPIWIIMSEQGQVDREDIGVFLRGSKKQVVARIADRVLLLPPALAA